MRALHAMMMLLGALAVLWTGGAPAGALADAPSSPPCHETATHAGGEEPPPSDSGKAMAAMQCCVACVAAPALKPPARARLVAPRPVVASPLAALPSGQRPAPEPHPPRVLLD
ncbi:MAG: DUF2946 family protein [Brevundimonas sp.]|uniref:DUF2946 family protein n=1 Tax=Brevundimonas sp. TaxID=1871086 RepID=UPI00391CE608